MVQQRFSPRSGARRLARLATDIVLPPVCPSCRSAIGEPDALCGKCWAAVRFIEPPYCAVYGTPFAFDLGPGILSAEALADPPPFRRARSAALFGDVTRSLVHQLKYQDRPYLAQVLATSMHRAGRELLDDAKVIVPIPLHRWRLWRRRFNQAALLGAELSVRSGVPHDPTILERVRHTRQQVGLSVLQRADNMRGAFHVPEGKRGRISGAPVLLVDDVYTSGATVKAAARALLQAGASAVDVITFARVA